jgi:hypothetical protein
MPVLTHVLDEQPDLNRFGANWQVQFHDAEGTSVDLLKSLQATEESPGARSIRRWTFEKIIVDTSERAH